MWTSNSAKSVFHIFCVDVVTGLKFGCSSVWRGSIRYGKRDDILLSPLSDYLFHFCTRLKYSCFTMPCTALISPSLKKHTLGPQMKVSSASSNIVKQLDLLSLNYCYVNIEQTTSYSFLLPMRQMMYIILRKNIFGRLNVFQFKESPELFVL